MMPPRLEKKVRKTIVEFALLHQEGVVLKTGEPPSCPTFHIYFMYFFRVCLVWLHVGNCLGVQVAKYCIPGALGNGVRANIGKMITFMWLAAAGPTKSIREGRGFFPVRARVQLPFSKWRNSMVYGRSTVTMV